MTDDEFQAQVLTLSTKIQSSLTQPGGDSARSTLSALAMTSTNTSDLDTALATLKADPAKLAAFERQIAAQVASATVALQPQASQTPLAPPPIPPKAPSGPSTPILPPTVVVPPAQPGAVREYMWVAPAVSGAVIFGFFIMLWILLNQQVHPTSTTVMDVAAKIAAAGDAEKAATAADADKQAADKKLADAKAASPQVAVTVDAAKKDADTKDAAAKDAVAKAAVAKAAADSSANSSPGGLQNVLFTLLGALGAAFTQVVNFWLGSSKGSSDKTALIAAANPVPGAR
jgi:hypothetical protein